MRISKAMYDAVRILTQLRTSPETPEGRLVNSVDLANQLGMSADMVASITRRLAKAGLVRSVLGRHGGLTIPHRAGSISLLDIMEAMDGPVENLMPFASESDHDIHPQLEAVCLKITQFARMELQRVRIERLKISQKNLMTADVCAAG